MSALSGSRDDFARLLIEEWQAPIYNYALRWLRDSAEAEDATQEIFIAILRDRHRLRSPEAIRAWIYKLASRQLIKHKARVRRQSRFDGEVEALFVAAREPAVAVVSEQTERCQVLRRSVRALPVRIRSAVTLKYFQGLTQQEIAEVLELPRSTVQSRLKKGLELLRESLTLSGAAVAAPELEALLASSPVAPVPSSLSSSLIKLGAQAPVRALISGGLMTTKLKTGLGIAALALLGLGFGYAFTPKHGPAPRPRTIAPVEVAAAETPIPLNAAKEAEKRRLAPPSTAEAELESPVEKTAPRRPSSGAEALPESEPEPLARAEEDEAPREEPKRAAPAPAKKKAGPFPGLVSDKSLWITIVDEISGERVEKAQVYLKPAEISTDSMAYTEAPEGRLVVNLTKMGPHKLMVYAEGYIAFDCELLRSARSTVGAVTIEDTLLDRGLTVRLIRGIPASGLVRDADLKPLEAKVSVLEVVGAGRGCLYQTQTREGRFKFKGLAPGRYELAAKAPGHPPATQMITIKLGSGPREFILTADRPLDVQGRVLSVDGLPIAGARIEAAPATSMGATLLHEGGMDIFEGHRATATSDAEGRFALPGLRPGKVDVVVIAPGFEGGVRLAVAVPARDPGALDFRLRPGGVIAGRAVDAAGEPLKDVQVVIRQKALDFPSFWTDASGRFRFEGLPAGSWRLLARQLAGPWVELEGIKPGETELEVLIGPGLTVVGQVERPPAGPKVGSLRCSAFGEPVKVEDDGRFTARLSVAAPRELRFEAEGYLPLTLPVAAPAEGAPLELKLKLRVAAAVSGTVLDSSGSPQGGVRVRAKDGRGRRLEVAADSLGRFRFPSLEPGELVLEVRWNDGLNDRISRLPLEAFDGMEIKDLILRLE